MDGAREILYRDSTLARCDVPKSRVVMSLRPETNKSPLTEYVRAVAMTSKGHSTVSLFPYPIPGWYYQSWPKQYDFPELNTRRLDPPRYVWRDSKSGFPYPVIKSRSAGGDLGNTVDPVAMTSQDMLASSRVDVPKSYRLENDPSPFVEHAILETMLAWPS